MKNVYCKNCRYLRFKKWSGTKYWKGQYYCYIGNVAEFKFYEKTNCKYYTPSLLTRIKTLFVQY
jgi:hypothetical protein